jgi:hypothetical protein
MFALSVAEVRRDLRSINHALCSRSSVMGRLRLYGRLLAVDGCSPWMVAIHADGCDLRRGLRRLRRTLPLSKR